MKKIAVLWFVVFCLAAISIAYTHQYLISPIWVVNAFAGYYLVRLRKEISHPISLFLFAFSTIFCASYTFDQTKTLELKALLSFISAVQIVSFTQLYYWVGLKFKGFKFRRSALLVLPNVLSALIGAFLFMGLLEIGQNYYEFVDYFLEQMTTGLAIVCMLYGAQRWRHIHWSDYLFLFSALLFQYLISLDRIFYACLILPVLMCYFALRHHLKQFSWLLGCLVLICSMYVSLPLAGEYWTENEVNMLSRISAYRLSLGIYLIIFLLICELYLVNQRLYRSLERMIACDELTGLATRHFVKQEIERNRLMIRGSALLLDVDNFKQVNDSYGHQVGDLVLKHVSKLLKDVCPASAVVSRWGGEEFLVLLPYYDRKACLALCERILEECQQRPFEHAELSRVMTFSIGASSFEYFGLVNYAQVLHHTDQLLYQAKAEGKNRFVYA